MTKDDGAFGFTLLDEDEIKAVENELSTQVPLLNKTIKSQDEKLKKIMSQINDFLTKLAESPEKAYLHWPDRSVRVKNFQNVINQIYSE